MLHKNRDRRIVLWYTHNIYNIYTTQYVHVQLLIKKKTAPLRTPIFFNFVRHDLQEFLCFSVYKQEWQKTKSFPLLFYWRDWQALYIYYTWFKLTLLASNLRQRSNMFWKTITIIELNSDKKCINKKGWCRNSNTGLIAQTRYCYKFVIYSFKISKMYIHIVYVSCYIMYNWGIHITLTNSIQNI